MSPASAPPLDTVVARILAVYRGWQRSTGVERMRADWEALFGSGPVSAAIEPVRVGGIDGLWVAAPGVRADTALLYCHGGGFQLGSTRTHLDLMARLSAGAGCRVLGIDYRLAPEHRFPAAHDDALAAYDGLLAQGFAPRHLALAGDSAGAGLAVSTLVTLRDTGRPLPAAAVLMSAWTDLTAGGDSYRSRAERDPIHQRPMILAMAAAYLGPDGEPADPRVSPLFADLHGLPPLLIQVGDRETVLSDSTEFAARAQAAGVPVTLEIWPDMIHVFQQFPRELVEAREALRKAGAFIAAHLTPGAHRDPLQHCASQEIR